MITFNGAVLLAIFGIISLIMAVLNEARKVSALETEDFLAARANSANDKAYLKVLKKVKKNPPLPGDEI
ncbi:MAG: hypothetical protein QM752_02685 [Gammaproteobacteria bacterium]